MEKPQQLHVLLIGIDAYVLPEHRLLGCVRDVDSLADFLTHEVSLAGSSLSIERLTARTGEPPGPDTPTRQRIVSALRGLSQERVSPGDRVLVYYAGHGARIYFPKAGADFEALVPADYTGQKEQLLFDYEVNELLAAIAERTGDLNVILDCCHSGGLTRALSQQQQSRVARSRYVRIEARADEPPPIPPRDAALGLSRSRGQVRPYCVIAACQANQRALELSLGEGGHEEHGLLSYSLLQVLRGPFHDRVATTRWAELWEPLRAEMRSHDPEQQPLLIGPSERFILGGATTPFSPGLALRQEPDGSLLLGAGTLSGISAGARLAVYPPTEPALFPPLDSPEDRAARLGHLVVRSADVVSAVVSVDPLAPLRTPLPTGARARLVQPAEEELLRVFCEPAVSPWVGEVLAAMRSVVRLVPDAAQAELLLGQSPSGELLLGDRVYPHQPSLSPLELAPLAIIPLGLQITDPALRDQRRRKALGTAVQHYAGYVQPLRLGQQPGTVRPAGALILELVDCGTPAAVANLRMDASRRRTIPLGPDGTCALLSGSQCCFYVRNDSWSGLSVTLLACTSEGWVHLLSEPVHLESSKGAFLWDYSESRALPFELSCGSRTVSIDRIIAIGCSDARMDVRSLQQQVIPQQEPSLQALINKALFSDTKLLVRRSARVLEFATATLNVKLMR
jgi:hypothetical protein